MLEDRGVVDEHGQRPAERRGGRRHQRGGRVAVEQVRREHGGAHARRPHLLGERLGGVAAAVAVDRHFGAARGQPAHQRGADPLRAAGDERRLAMRGLAEGAVGAVAGLGAGAEHVGVAGGALARRLDRAAAGPGHGRARHRRIMPATSSSDRRRTISRTIIARGSP